jgi:FMN reductase
MTDDRPFIVGLGGTVRSGSTSETALRTALEGAESAGARTACFGAAELDMPFYDPKSRERSPAATRLVAALRAADGIVLSSPGYHGALSGLVKNALDYVEDMVDDERVYLAGLPVGCIGVAYGSQAAVSVLGNLRSIAHALRGFPTPYGAAIVAGPGVFVDGACSDADTAMRLRLVGEQVVDFAHRSHPSMRAAVLH